MKRISLLAVPMLIASLLVPSVSSYAADAPADEEAVVVSESKTYDADVYGNGIRALANGKLALYSNGKFVSNFNGFFMDAAYGWVYVQNGYVNTAYTGLAYDPTYGWWLVVNGSINFTYSDFVCDPTYGIWLVRGGTVDFGYTGWFNSPAFGSWYVTGGMLDVAKSTGGAGSTTTDSLDAIKAKRQEIASRVGYGYSIGQVLPDSVTVKDLNGNNVYLTDYLGQPLYMNVFTTWCGPCKREMPSLEAAYENYKGRVNFITVCLDGSAYEASAFKSSYGLQMPMYTASKIGTYYISCIPQQWIIDKYGRIVDIIEGGISQSYMESLCEAAIKSSNQ